MGPNYVPPEAVLPDQWSQEPTLAHSDDELARWWERFEDPTLNSLILFAINESLNLQMAALRVIEARAALGIAHGRHWPQQQSIDGTLLNVGLSDNQANARLADKSFSTFDLGFDATWELDLWGRFQRGIEAASGDYEGALANYHDIRVLVTAEVARAYVLLRTFETRLNIARRNVVIQENTLRIAIVRHRNGAVTELDVAQARSLLKDTQALIPLLTIGRDQSQHAIAVLLGKPPGEIDELLSTSGPIPIALPIAVGLPLDLLRRRPDVRQAERAAAAQSARIGIAKSDLYPRFALLGSIGLHASDASGPITANATASDIFKRESLRFTTGPIFSWPILNYGRLRNAVRVEDARFEQAALAYQQTVLNAAREVEDALTGRREHHRRRMKLSESTHAAERSVALSLVQYREGSVNYQRVLDAQRFLVQQEDRTVRAHGAVALSDIGLYKALGGGWSMNDQPYLPPDTRLRMENRTHWGDVLSGITEVNTESRR